MSLVSTFITLLLLCAEGSGDPSGVSVVQFKKYADTRQPTLETPLNARMFEDCYMLCSVDSECKAASYNTMAYECWISHAYVISNNLVQASGWTMVLKRLST